ncbi:MAG: hypothetical protein JWM19_3660 [Actinomycetia bacterium]|nr:hypothetical protein [Actinomycetes bacterium]
MALSAGSLAASLAGCGAPAQAAAPAAARAAAASLAAPQAATPGWRAVATLGNAALVDGLSASGKNNAWLSETICAAGKCADLTGLTGQQLRWNGTAWRSVTLPRAYARGIAVPASPASNWIVGSVPDGKDATRNVVLHWTGKDPGTVTPLGKNAGIGTGVAPAAKDAWLFGDSAVGGPDGSTYALHYTGSAWKPVTVPFVGQGASASSPANVWVSGYSAGDDAAGVMAFDGTRWRTVPLPPLPSSLLYTGSGNIAAASRKSVWLEIGRTSDGAHSTPYLLHWTGSQWTSIKIPYGLADMGGAPVAQDGHGGVWLSLADINDPAHAKTFLLHYLNGTWTRIPVPATKGYEVLGPVTLAWIPGTRSLWGAAVELNPKSPRSPGKALILKYGP